MEKCGVLHFRRNNLRNGASYALDHSGTLITFYNILIKWYHLQACTTTWSAWNRAWNPQTSVIHGCKQKWLPWLSVSWVISMWIF